jgi:hypothetical protein
MVDTTNHRGGGQDELFTEVLRLTRVANTTSDAAIRDEAIRGARYAVEQWLNEWHPGPPPPQPGWPPGHRWPPGHKQRTWQGCCNAAVFAVTRGLVDYSNPNPFHAAVLYLELAEVLNAAHAYYFTRTWPHAARANVEPEQKGT